MQQITINRKKRFKPELLRPFRSEKEGKNPETPTFCTIDIEAQDWTEYVCGEVYGIDKKNIEFFKETPNIIELMIECFRIHSEHNISNFVAHFGGKYDFLFFIGVLVRMGFIEIGDIVPRGSSILSFSATLRATDDPRINFKIRGGKITFRDSSALLPFALGSLTKSFNVPTLKGEMDFLFVKKTYYEQDYLPDILTHKDASLFYKRKRVYMITDDIRKNQQHLRYWNADRFRMFPYRGKKLSYTTPYMLKLNKKTKLIEYNDWFEAMTYPIFTKDDLLKYLHGDCKSLYQCVEAFFKAPLINESQKKWTTASQSVEVFRMFMDKPLHSIPDSDEYREGNVDEFVRRAYFGGRTEVIKPVFDSELLGMDWLYYQDINSLYPYVMRENPYPNRFLRWTTDAKDYETHEMSIWHCKVRVPHDMYIPCLPVKYKTPRTHVEGEDDLLDDERLIFPVGQFDGFWTRHELKYAESLGCQVVEVYKGALFENAGYIFKPFVNTLYNMRLDAKKKGEHVTQMTMKLLMNSCYGRMGINKDFEKIVIDDFSDPTVVGVAEIETPEGIIRLGTRADRGEKMFSNPAIACFVTSYARVYLHQWIMKAGPEKVYYMDTDSLFTSVQLPVGDQLGEMKLEYKCKSACFLLPKTYVNEGIVGEEKGKTHKITMKGFDYKSVRNAFDFEDFMEHLRGDLDRLKIVERPKFATLKTALKNGEFTAMTKDPNLSRIRDLKKEEDYFKKTGKKRKFVKKEYQTPMKKIQSDYNKRLVVKDNFDSIPIRIYQ